MSSVSYYTRKDSPFYFLRIYKSKHQEPNPKKRRSSRTTKIRATRAGERRIKQIVKELNADFVRQEQLSSYGINLKEELLLSTGLDRFLASKPDLAIKTIDAYELSTRHMLRACDDRIISTYGDSDYTDFIKYLNKKEFSESSKSIFTRHLSAMWNYFIKEGWAQKNIIVKIKSTKTNNLPIHFKDMQKILKYYSIKNIDQFNVIYGLLLTGFRPSTIIVLDWKDINFDLSFIKALNVKGKKFFIFPLHSELREHLEKMGRKKKGNVFGYSRTDSLNFFNKDVSRLFYRGNLGSKYTLYQLRNTFSSWLANKNVNVSSLQVLLDHSDVKITKKHYTIFEVDFLRDQIEKVRFKKKDRKKK